MARAQVYFLGDHQAESARLEFQAKAWREVTLGLCADAGIAAGQRVVDLGCGPGLFTFDLAAMVGPRGHILAVDKSEEFLTAVRSRAQEAGVANVTVLSHDIEDAPLPEGGFDVVFTRWLDPYVDDLNDLIAKELQCIRVGGRTVSLGTFNYQGVCMAPWSNEFDLITRKIIEYYERNGRRISAGNLVPAILCAHGATIVRISNASRLAQPNEDLWEWYRQFSFSMLPRLHDAGLVGHAEIDAYATVWEQRARTRGAFISVPSHIGVVAEKTAV